MGLSIWVSENEPSAVNYAMRGAGNGFLLVRVYAEV